MKKYIAMNYNKAFFVMLRWCVGMVVGGFFAFGVSEASAQVRVEGSVFGGGNAANVTGNSTVLMQDNATVVTDVYGGGALANVGTNNSNATTVTITGGTVTGSVYGGGLGDGSTAALVKGVVTVNIGSGTVDPSTGFATSVSGSATIGGSVFGCNNANGTPQDNVFVNIFQTDHTSGVNTVSDAGFALSQVFGGGNQAAYLPSNTGKKTTVHIYTCDNTIEYVYGGGNAADVGNTTTNSATEVIIDGGRIEWVFGGGNGKSTPTFTNPGANIYGNATVQYHGGKIQYLFGGSNEKGTVTGDKAVNILNDASCDKQIAELYGGSNKATTSGNVTISVPCSAASSNFKIGSIFGGSREADITGNITFDLYGGKYDYVFGGNNIDGEIGGNVTLNLYGGTIEQSAFGGNKGGGSILGNITVNVTDAQNATCPLEVNNVFGAGDQAMYTAPTGNGARENNPIVNINHIRTGKSITGNVYGGGNGDPADATQEPGMVTGNPKVVIGDVTAGNESYLATISGNVYGGGNAAKVVGTTTVLMQKANSTVAMDIYGGGNLADVSGATDVDINGGTVTQDVYGGGALADVGGSDVTLAGGTVRDIYGGGLGDNTHPALVNGAVQVTVNSGTVNDVFGCNNVNGRPTGAVTVNINNDVDGNVYGGGNLATYTGDPYVYINKGTVAGHVFGGGNGDPDDATQTLGSVTGTPHVIVGDMTVDHESYQAIVSSDVYGGGNAAKVIGTTSVLIQKCNTVVNGDVYGGGNAANIAKNGDEGGSTSVTVTGGTINGTNHGMVFGGGHGDKDANPVVSANVAGNTNVAIQGGTINQVFGGSNSSGTIAGTINVNIDKDANACPMVITEVYGGGNYAASNAGNITIGCTGASSSEYIGTVYGGANRANITSDIELTITGGRINNVFGGNNNSGTISGDITVNVEWATPACSDQYLGNVYGGGNLAPHTGNPAVNLKNGTATNVFGGGKGSTAIVTGDPVVTIGDNNASHVAIVSGNVYGGGDAAAVSGNTSVTYNDNNASSTVANLFGGGNAAGVSGTTAVTLTSGKVTAGVYGGCNASGSVGDVTITLTNGQVGTDANHTADVYGGGFGSATTTTGNIGVSLGSTTVYGDLYGGSALGSVNASTSDNTTLTIGGANLHGTIYGGGKGDNSTTATTLGNVIINYNTANAGLAGLYGGANINGNVAGDINVYVDANVGATGNGNSRDIFGGGLGAATTTDGNVTVTVGNSSTPTIYGDLYGGSALGEVGANGKIAKVDFKAGTLNGSIYGGGMGQNTPSAVSATVSGGTEVAVTNGSTITGSIYGGCNERGNVVGDITVDITGGTIDANGSPASVFGGGYGANTATQGDVIVNINGSGVTVWGDVYGGSGFGNVNNESSDATTVNILNGEVKQHVFGGGLGSKSPAYAAAVNGVVTVNIGSDNGDGTYSGNAIIGGNVYGCNNTNGSPQQDVTVNIYATNHPSGTLVGESGYAIANVFGGGKEADFNANGKKAYVNVYSCANTIGRVFGGGDAAAVTGTEVMIQGGRFNYVFGGGNGEVQAANVGAGGITLELHGGTINTLVSGSNTLGTISGPINVTVDNNSPCSEEVTDFFGGSNQVDIATNVTTTIECGAGTITNVYGGSNAANITGNVILNVKGGTMTNVFGGSKGVQSGTAANIDGNVTLNLYGGTMVNAFGGSDQNGNITGNIAVNVLDHEGTCKLDVTNIYGAGNVTPYAPTSPSATSPTVNVMHVKVSEAVADDPATTDVDESRPAIPGIRGSVFGGGLGNTAVVTAQPRVNIGYTSAMSSLPTVQYPDASINRDTYTAIVCGSLYGGGDAAAVTGSPIVTIDNGSSMVKERIIGGGNAANVTGNTHVIVNDGVFGTGTGASRGVYGGCNTTGTVSGNAVVDVLGGTFGTQADVNNKVSYNLHGGGFGADTRVSGNVTVNYGVDNGSASDYPKLYGDIYGGSALGHVNTDGSNTTTVYVLNGSFGFYGERRNYQMVDGDTVGGYIIQHGGNIYGGGLGQAYVAAAAAIPDDPATPQDESRPAQEEVPAIAAKVYGVVHVNIGRDNGGGSYSGKANLALCNVYGCNNAQGSPQQNVYVDVWQTAHTTKNTASYVAGLDDDVTELFAIRNVYGGGNAADFNPDDSPETKKVYNRIHTCSNTVENVYGGGNAASVMATDVFVEGGRYNYIFAGGNGQITAADVEGNADMVIRAGRVGWYFEGCNMQGVIRGTVFVQAGCGTGDQAPCHCGDLKVENYYFGANMATVVGDKISEVVCGGPNPFDYRNVYAGSRLATIYGNIVLTVRGGTIGNLYGGSEGNDVISADIRKAPADWDDIDNFPVEHQAALREHFANHAHDEDYGKGGNITLYLYGGDIENVFGGSNYRGTVEGDIHIIVDSSTSCPLDIDYLYGGSQLSKYAPDGNTTDPDRVSPLVELRNGHVNYDVFGGSRGGRPTHPWGNGVMYSNPKVIVGSKTTGKFRIGGNLYGGGSAGDVNGDTEIKIDGHLDAGSNPTTNIIGNVFGGGKSGDVNGNSKVTIVTE